MFADALDLELKLRIGEKTFQIPGASVKNLTIDLRPYGLSGSVDFWVSSQETTDPLLRLFMTDELINVRLKVSVHLAPEGRKIESMILKSLVTEKALLEETTIRNVPLKDKPVLCRHYELTFADAAQVLWRQHVPCDLMLNRTLKDLLSAHQTKKVTVNYDWSLLDEEFAISALPPTSERGQASFYDFVMWLVKSNNGVFVYDHLTDTYTLCGEKEVDGEVRAVNKRDIEESRIDFPETIRNSINLLNAYSESPKRELITQQQAIAGVHRDIAERFLVDSEFTNRTVLENAKLKSREHEVHLKFARFPCMAYLPGNLMKLEGALWSEQIFSRGKVYRVRDVFIEAHAVAQGVDADHNLPYSRYELNMQSRLELKTETWVSLPSFKPPVFPFFVEGKVLSEQGDDTALTYQTYQDPKTSLDQYKVEIPLFDNQRIVTAFEPGFFPGHFYFSAYKGARVLVAVHFHTASVERFLDWRPGARLPLDTQGNHLLMGKTETNRTSLEHVYEDDKPVLKIERALNEDTELIRLEEGSLVLQTKERMD